MLFGQPLPISCTVTRTGVGCSAGIRCYFTKGAGWGCSGWCSVFGANVWQVLIPHGTFVSPGIAPHRAGVCRMLFLARARGLGWQPPSIWACVQWTRSCSTVCPALPGLIEQLKKSLQSSVSCLHGTKGVGEGCWGAGTGNLLLCWKLCTLLPSTIYYLWGPLSLCPDPYHYALAGGNRLQAAQSRWCTAQHGCF